MLSYPRKLRNTSKIPGFLENSTTIRPLRGRKSQTYIDRYSSTSSIEWTHFYSNSMLVYPPKLRNTSKIRVFSKTAPGFAHRGNQNLKPIQIGRALSNGLISTQIPCFHIPQNCEIPPKSLVFSKTPSRFAH